LDVIGDSAYLAAFDYRRGDQLWRSTNGMDWRLMFQQPKPSWYGMGGGPIEYQGHILMIDNDLKRGVEIWRSDAAVVAAGTTSTSPSASPNGGGGDDGGGGATGEDAGATATSGGLSGAWLAAIFVAVVALACAVAAFAYARVRARRPATGSPAPVAETAARGGVAGTAPATRSFCSECGSPLDPDAKFCASCGMSVPGPV